MTATHWPQCHSVLRPVVKQRFRNGIGPPNDLPFSGGAQAPAAATACYAGSPARPLQYLMPRAMILRPLLSVSNSSASLAS